jgi:hypothetical protein
MIRGLYTKIYVSLYISIYGFQNLSKLYSLVSMASHMWLMTNELLNPCRFTHLITRDVHNNHKLTIDCLIHMYTHACEFMTSKTLWHTKNYGMPWQILVP